MAVSNSLHVLTLMMPGRSTRTILCSPGPLTVMLIVSGLTVRPPLTLLRIRTSTSRRRSLSWSSLCGGWTGHSQLVKSKSKWLVTRSWSKAQASDSSKWLVTSEQVPGITKLVQQISDSSKWLVTSEQVPGITKLVQQITDSSKWQVSSEQVPGITQLVQQIRDSSKWLVTSGQLPGITQLVQQISDSRKWLVTSGQLPGITQLVQQISDSSKWLVTSGQLPGITQLVQQISDWSLICSSQIHECHNGCTDYEHKNKNSFLNVSALALQNDTPINNDIYRLCRAVTC